MKKGFLVFGSVAVLFVLMGCSAPSEAILDQERQEWFSSAQPIAENIVHAVKASDFNAYQKDFSGQMKQAITEESFAELRSTLGDFEESSISPANAVKVGEYVSANFSLELDNGNSFLMRLVFNPNDKATLQGLWFN